MDPLDRRDVLAAVSAAALSTAAGCAELLDGGTDDESTETEASDANRTAGEGSDDADELTEPDSPVGVARRFVEELGRTRIEEAHDLVAPDATVAVTLETTGGIALGELEQVWMGYTAAGGAFEEITAVEEPETVGFEHEPLLDDETVVDVAMAFENGPDGMRLGIDDGAVAVIIFNGEYERPAYVDPGAFVERPVTVEADDCSLEGLVTLPTDAATGTDEVPGVVLVHGSGPGGKNLESGGTQLFRDLAEGLASRGIATLRYDKRTFSCFVPPEAHSLDRVTVDDALLALDELRAVEGVDEDRIVVLGHSMGGLAVPRIAGRDGSLAGAIALAAPARPVYDLFVEQSEHLATVGEYDWTAMAADYRHSRIERERIRDGEYDPGEIVLGYPGALWESFESYDQLEQARSIGTPLFFLQGERDYQVPPEDFEVWKDELEERPETSFESYADLEHGFMPGEGPAVFFEALATNNVDERVIDDVADWIGER